PVLRHARLKRPRYQRAGEATPAGIALTRSRGTSRPTLNRTSSRGPSPWPAGSPDRLRREPPRIVRPLATASPLSRTPDSPPGTPRPFRWGVTSSTWRSQAATQRRGGEGGLGHASLGGSWVTLLAQFCPAARIPHNSMAR